MVHRLPNKAHAYVHSDPWSGNMRSFRVPRGEMRHPVKGGRWKIRKRHPFILSRRPDLKPWVARTDGQAKRWNKSFNTHDEAVRWAHFIALMYKVNSKDVAIRIIKEYQRRTL